MARKSAYSKGVAGSVPSDYEKRDNKSYYYKKDASIVISRGTYEDVRAKDTGWTGRTERDKARRTSEYKRWITGTMQSGQKPQFDRNEFEKNYLAAKKSDWSKDANGPFAQFLVWIGMRDKDATYPVGQTPSKKRR